MKASKFYHGDGTVCQVEGHYVSIINYDHATSYFSLAFYKIDE